MITIFVVEDDSDWNRTVKDALVKAGYRVTSCYSLSELWDALANTRPNAIILDARLPDGSGFDALTRIRKEAPHSCILMLTGMVQSQFRIKGLLDGADCYLTKPVMTDEILANLCAVLRRRPQPQRHEQPLSLSIERQSLISPNAGDIPLTPQEYTVFRVMALQPLYPVSKSKLISSLGYQEYEYDNHRLETLMYRLRRKLKNIESELSIKAVYGKGYYINYPVQIIS
ncbi:response regulator transcription factor [Oceanisphaera sp. KMM 10153]|uniref:response regulator transcription factor n=1 Tax=Oceanisphaera submarina TaxID=3390193 RepID=UPI0039765109